MLVVPSYAQKESSVELLKVVWVYQFLNYIGWPNEQKINTFTISYWGDDSHFYKNLLALNGRKVRTSHIKVVRQNTITPQSNVQVIVVGKTNSQSLAKLQSSLRGKSTLIISDHATNKQNIMINFVYPDVNSIAFELNRYNIINEKLSLSSDILVIGGTEIDIAKVLNEMHSKLDKTKVLLANRENTLTALASNIAGKENKIMVLQQEITIKTQDIERRQAQSSLLNQEMNKLLLTLKNSREELSSNNQYLADKHQQLIKKEKDIKKLSDAIEANKLTLAQQKMHLDQHKKTLASQEVSLVIQEQELSSKTSKIRQQNIVMILSFTFILLGLIIVWVLQKNSRNKKKALTMLSAKNIELAQTNEQLINTQSQLVESEKMAALGSLVAGVAHEINTPLGVSVTAISTCQYLLRTFMSSVAQNKVTRTEMHKFLDRLNQATALITTNLGRAKDLIRQFKLVAVDQSSEEKRQFLLAEYLNEVLSSLYPQYKKYHCAIEIDCASEITMNSYPGGIAQIMTNLVINSTLHGFTIEKTSLIQLAVKIENKNVIITYQDNGTGIDKDKYAQVFTPFYTTKRGQGGSGLGLHICYNIASKLGGDIKCLPCERGAKFMLTIAKDL